MRPGREPVPSPIDGIDVRGGQDPTAVIDKPKPPIEKAVQYAEQLGWRVVMSNGHAWGRLFCPHSTRDGCIISVWSTPRNPENHARHTRQ